MVQQQQSSGKAICFKWKICQAFWLWVSSLEGEMAECIIESIKYLRLPRYLISCSFTLLSPHPAQPQRKHLRATRRRNLKCTITDAVILTHYITENRKRKLFRLLFSVQSEEETRKQHNLHGNAENNFMLSSHSALRGRCWGFWRGGAFVWVCWLSSTRGRIKIYLNVQHIVLFARDYLWVCVLPLKCNNILLECLLSNNNGDRLFRQMPLRAHKLPVHTIWSRSSYMLEREWRFHKFCRLEVS